VIAMQYRLRTLLIVLALGPPVLAGARRCPVNCEVGNMDLPPFLQHPPSFISTPSRNRTSLRRWGQFSLAALLTVAVLFALILGVFHWSPTVSALLMVMLVLAFLRTAAAMTLFVVPRRSGEPASFLFELFCSIAIVLFASAAGTVIFLAGFAICYFVAQANHWSLESLARPALLLLGLALATTGAILWFTRTATQYS